MSDSKPPAPAQDDAAHPGVTGALAGRGAAVTPSGTMKIWAAIGESVARDSGGAGLDETAASVLHARAFRHFAEGVRQYLAIRLGSAEAADIALRRLRLTVAAWPATELVAAPGPRARLYRKARELAHAQRGAGGDAGAATGSSLPWRPLPPGTPASYVRALAQVRALPPELTEVLELRHARELSEAELAFVLDADAGDVSARLTEATRRAEEFVGADPPSALPGFAGAMIEAFALSPPESASASVRASEEPGGIEPGTVLGGRYRLEKRVGAGAFGEVYKASDTEVPGHLVALKLLHQPSLSENARANALRELNLIASVFHPSIVQFKDHGWFAGRLWFVMPWYEGEPLEKRIARQPLTRAEARTLFEPIARALATMHASGLRHQDIKPDNVFLARLKTSARSTSADVLPVLLDLGVAVKDTELTLAGTPLYFPPEIAAEFANVACPYPVTLAADVFSLALTLRNALEPSTQEHVPSGAVDAFIAHRATHVPRPPSGHDLRYLAPQFERWLNPDPARRPTADELADELTVLTAPEERRARRARTLRWLVPLLAALAVVGGAAFYALRKDAQLSALLAAQAQADASNARAETTEIKADLAITQAREQALADDNGSLQDAIRRSNLSQEQLVRELATTQAQVQRLGEAVERTSERAATLAAALEATEAQGAQLTTDLAQMRSAREAAEQRSTQLTTELGSARQSLATREAELTTARQSLAAREGELAQVRADEERLTRELTEARTDAERLTRELADARSDAANAATRIAAAEERRADAERDVSELRRELERLRNVQPAAAAAEP
jgi:serine/threonine protein kinase